jgi:hypothetical protein
MSGDHKHATAPEHMASSHRRSAGWTIEPIRKEAAWIRPATAALCELIIDADSEDCGHGFHLNAILGGLVQSLPI